MVYHHTDHLSGASVETDNDGYVVEVIDYNPFGSSRLDEKYTNTYENDKKFTGYELDDTGLHYANARYYNADVGRFTSLDPAHLAVGDSSFESRYNRSLRTHLSNPQSLNSYVYVNNNPLKYTDPDGEIIPILIAAWAVAEVGLSAYDIYDAISTVASDASLTDKGLSVGGVMLGVVLPGGGYGTGAKQVVKHADEGVDLALKFKKGWNKVQRSAAKLKAKMLTDADTVVTKKPVRDRTMQSVFRKTHNVESTMDVDHIQELQLGGKNTFSNLMKQDKSVNRSFGSQIRHQIKDLPEGTRVNRVNIKD